MRRLATAVLLLFLSATAWAKPTVFWASSPVAPGETVLYYGDGLAAADRVTVVRLDDTPTLATRLPAPELGQECPVAMKSAVSVMAALPQGLQPGVYVAWVRTPEGWSDPIHLNKADAWWAQGNLGLAAEPGGWMRVSGRNLAWPKGEAVPLVLVGGRSLTTRVIDAYSLEAQIPADMAEGTYPVLVSNGRGDDSAWDAHLTLTVSKRPNWPAAVWNLKDPGFGATGDGKTDDSGAFLKALAEAAANGGGTIYLPEGHYLIRSARTLVLPPQTVLKGAGMDKVDITFLELRGGPPEAVVDGTSLGIKDLTIYFGLAQGGVRGTDDSFLNRVRLRWLLYPGRLTVEQQAERERQQAKWARACGDLVRFSGRNIRITDSDLYSSGGAFSLNNIEGGIIARNIFVNGNSGWYMIQGKERILFEDNRIIGGDLRASGGSIFSTREARTNQYIYVARNTFSGIYGYEREAITTDGPSRNDSFIGPIAAADSRSVTYPARDWWKPGELVGYVCYIAEGKGKGQFRRILTNTETTLTVDRPWAVVPGPGAIAGITFMNGNNLYVGNTANEAFVTVQLYGTSLNVIVAENHSIRTSGIRGYAKTYPHDAAPPYGIQPQMFIQFLDNRVEGGAIRTDPLLTLKADAPALPWPVPMTLGAVLRHNTLSGNAKLLIDAAAATPTGKAPLIEDVIVEDNAMDNPAGPLVQGRTERVLVRSPVD